MLWIRLNDDDNNSTNTNGDTSNMASLWYLVIQMCSVDKYTMAILYGVRYKSHKNYEPNACYHNENKFITYDLQHIRNVYVCVYCARWFICHGGGQHTHTRDGNRMDVIRRIAASCILLINFPEMYRRYSTQSVWSSLHSTTFYAALLTLRYSLSLWAVLSYLTRVW